MALAPPILQLPIFISFFFGIRDLGTRVAVYIICIPPYSNIPFYLHTYTYTSLNLYSPLYTYIHLYIYLHHTTLHIGTYYPAYSTGGAYWFTDLSSPDTTYILPVLNAATMLVVFETLGIQGVSAQQQQLVKYVARSFILFVVPTLTTTIPQVSNEYILS